MQCGWEVVADSQMSLPGVYHATSWIVAVTTVHLTLFNRATHEKGKGIIGKPGGGPHVCARRVQKCPRLDAKVHLVWPLSAHGGLSLEITGTHSQIIMLAEHLNGGVTLYIYLLVEFNNQLIIK